MGVGGGGGGGGIGGNQNGTPASHLTKNPLWVLGADWMAKHYFPIECLRVWLCGLG